MVAFEHKNWLFGLAMHDNAEVWQSMKLNCPQGEPLLGFCERIPAKNVLLSHGVDLLWL